VKLRALAFVIATIFVATPALAVICEMDCERPSAAPRCHESSVSGSGSTIRGVQHGCDHDHALDNPALAASTGARESGRHVAALPSTTSTHADTVGIVGRSSHGPPGLRSPNSPNSIHTTVLRI
jgi:hypothetical protein